MNYKDKNVKHDSINKAIDFTTGIRSSIIALKSVHYKMTLDILVISSNWRHLVDCIFKLYSVSPALWWWRYISVLCAQLIALTWSHANTCSLDIRCGVNTNKWFFVKLLPKCWWNAIYRKISTVSTVENISHCSSYITQDI